MEGSGRQPEAWPEPSPHAVGCPGSLWCDVFLLDPLHTSVKKVIQRKLATQYEFPLPSWRQSDQEDCLSKLACSLHLFSGRTGCDRKLKWEERGLKDRFLHSIHHSYPPLRPQGGWGQTTWLHWRAFSALFYVMTFGAYLFSWSEHLSLSNCISIMHPHSYLHLWFSEMHWETPSNGQLICQAIPS